ncbi:MAG: hypothetical protein IJE46_06820 [Clostridia bacterium]|nr:hypothetical protein [Clostridia bacterium]
MKTVDKLLKILKEEGDAVLRGTLARDVQKGNVTPLNERLENYYFMRGVAVLPLPGTQLWYITKDGNEKYCRVSSGKFIALGRDCVVMTTNVEPEKLIKECAEHFVCRTAVYVFPVGDVFESEEDAREELVRRSENYAG